MAQFLVCFMLANLFAAAAMALSSDHEPEVGASSPARAPKRMPQIARKLGAPPAPSPLLDRFDPNESQSSESTAAAAPEESKNGAEHRRQSDKSVTGGRVILGGLATTFLVAIFCYIRATRRLSNAAKAAEQSPAHHQLP